jgi:hypothetical protein
MKEREVARVMMGDMTFDDLAALLAKKGYTAERHFDSLNRSDGSIYKRAEGASNTSDGHPPSILFYWYDMRKGGSFFPVTIEAQIVGMLATGEDSTKITLYSFGPQEAYDRLEEIEARLVRAWNAINEK